MLKQFFYSLAVPFKRPLAFLPAFVASGFAVLLLQPLFQEFINEFFFQFSGNAFSVEAFLLQNQLLALQLFFSFIVFLFLLVFSQFLFAQIAFDAHRKIPTSTGIIVGLKQFKKAIAVFFLFAILFALLSIVLFGLGLLLSQFLLALSIGVIIVLLIAFVLAIGLIELAPIMSIAGKNLKDGIAESWLFSKKNLFGIIGIIVGLIIFNGMILEFLKSYASSVITDANQDDFAQILINAYSIAQSSIFVALYYYNKSKKILGTK